MRVSNLLADVKILMDKYTVSEINAAIQLLTIVTDAPLITLHNDTYTYQLVWSENQVLALHEQYTSVGYIQSIKWFREKTGAGLAQAKQCVDNIARDRNWKKR